MPKPGAPSPHGNRLQLLQGSAAYFPALVDAMDRAREEIRLETYIFDVTGSGAQVAEAMERAARRGVATYLVVDGVGTPTLPAPWPGRFAAAGVQWHVFAPLGTLGLLIPSRWRRLHRKLCVVDGALAFCGGINILDDLYDPNHGVLTAPRLDFALSTSGDLVRDVRDAMVQLWWRMRAADDVRERRLTDALAALREAGPPWAVDDRGSGGANGSRSYATAAAQAVLLLRDNVRHRARIEKAYRRAIGAAREEILIANAYFLPGRKLRQALIHAARRGVKVQLLLQGRYEYFFQYHATRPVYGALLRAGVEIFEYSASFLHAKVAVIDGRWATVGSSNLDPLSLLLAREANVMVQNREFAQDLRAKLLHAIHDQSVAVEASLYAARPWRQRLRDRMAFALVRAALFLSGYRY